MSNIVDSAVLDTGQSSDEITKFNGFAHDWWKPDGRMAMLHAMHPARMEFIVRQIARLDQSSQDQFSQDQFSQDQSLRSLDIGCGGGITAESLCRLGHTVTAIDAAEDLINIARDHAAQQDLTIDYRAGHIQAGTGDLETPDLGVFDLVCALEVVEHVDDPAAFLRAAMDHVRIGGILVVSTINRTLKSRLAAIGMAEYILGLLPIGTHRWASFVKPSEIIAALPQARLLDMAGMLPLGGFAQWKLVRHKVAVNYIIALQKTA